MDNKSKQRLKELKLAIYINHIDKQRNKAIYLDIMKLFSCVVKAFGEEYEELFIKMWQKSIADNLMGASNKEIIATVKEYFTNAEASSKLGISSAHFYRKYRDLLDRKFMTKEFTDSLTPMFDSYEAYVLVEVLIKFIEDFHWKLGKKDHELREHKRTLEIEFYLIYDRLMNIIQNSGICDKIIYNICYTFNIDSATIMNLKNNIHVISRIYPNFRYSHRYFMQELVYLYNKKGLSKYDIATKVLNKSRSFFYNGTNKKYCELLDNEDASWQYATTIEWSNMRVPSVLSFIDVFHSFIRYDV